MDGVDSFTRFTTIEQAPTEELLAEGFRTKTKTAFDCAVRFFYLFIIVS